VRSRGVSKLGVIEKCFCFVAGRPKNKKQANCRKNLALTPFTLFPPRTGKG
jgi:hypothetical protein